jgi:hypothetical protein
VGSDHIQVGLRDDAHPQLIIGTRQEAGKRRDKGHCPVPGQECIVLFNAFLSLENNVNFNVPTESIPQKLQEKKIYLLALKSH